MDRDLVTLTVALSLLIPATTLFNPANADLTDPCETVLSTVGTDEEHVCYNQEIATTAPKKADNAKLYTVEDTFDTNDTRIITFTVSGYGNYTTLSHDEENWTDPLPTSNASHASTLSTLANATTASDTYRLTHLRTPMIEAFHDRLNEHDIQIQTYLSHGWYLTDTSNATTAPSDLPFVDKTASFNTTAKIQQGLTTLNGTIPTLIRSMPNQPGSYNDTLDAIQRVNGTITTQHEETNLTEANVSADQLTTLAQDPSIIRIETGNLTPTAHMNEIRSATGADAAHTSSPSIAPEGWTGNNITAMIMDTGFDTSNEEINSSIAGYWPNENAILDGEHGTKVFSVAHADDGDGGYLRGMALNASSVMAQRTQFDRYPAATDLQVVHDGVIQSHSWGLIDDWQRQALYQNTGTPAWNTYDLRALENDLIGFEQQVLPFQAMANSGPGKAAAEAMAKNTLSIGGMYHNDDANLTNDTWDAGNGDQASTGPTLDCRTKPDLVGPRDRINTFKNGGIPTTFSGTSGATPVASGAGMLVEEMYREGRFTSASGEDTSGRPSPAALKALLVNNAHSYAASQTNADFDNGRCGPSTEDPRPRHSRDVQGWGQPNLTAYANENRTVYVIDEPFQLDTGDYANHTITVPEGAYALNVTLTWTDPPGAPLVNGLDMVNMTNPEDGNRTLADTVVPRQLVNDLDLEAHGPNGNTYPGNRGLDNDADSDKGHRSIHADRTNNIENVLTNAPTTGDTEEWTIQVHGSHVQMPASPDGQTYGQSYALVIQPVDDPSYSGGGGGGGENLGMKKMDI